MLENIKKSISIVAISLVVVVTFVNVVSFAATGDKKTSIPELPIKAAIMDVSSNRYSKPENFSKVKNTLNLDGFTKILEDSKLEIWHKDKNASIRIVDKVSGYIWGGLPSDKPEDMNTTWSGIGNSLASIDYFDVTGVEKRLSIADSTVEKSYKLSGNVLKYSVHYLEVGISFDFEMELKNGELSFRMINSSIKEDNKDYSLAAIYFVPFLGSTRNDEMDGYMFVPDGPGALMRFSKPSKYLVIFDKRIYGRDYAIDNLNEPNDLEANRPNDFTTEEPTVSMPIFGVVQGVKQNAIFARVVKGAEYTNIMATPSGAPTNYNWITGKIIYRQKYLQPTSRNGAGVFLPQKTRNSFESEIAYNFLSGNDADYVGMAKFYRNILKNEDALPKNNTVNSSIPIQIDVIGADIEKGFLFNSVKNITSTEQMKNMIDNLASEGINNITMILKGWQKGGIGGNKPANFNFESKLGGNKSLTEISQYVDSKGGKFYYYENPVTVNKSQLNLKSEAGNALSQSLIDVVRDNFDVWFQDTYFIKSNLVADYVSKKAKQYKDSGMKGMAINEFGSKLYSENLVNRVTSRVAARTKSEKAAETVATSIDNLALYNPNQYLWKYAKDMFSTPMVNTQFLFETDTVPFLQIVLKGSVEYYGPYSNMSFYSKNDILKLVEYGANPAFLLTGLGNSEMQYTTSSELFSTKYEDWKTNIVEIYNYTNKALSKVQNKMIIDRNVLIPGVVKVDYEGGISIIVNYTGNAFIAEGMNVPAQDYSVIGGL